MEKKKQVPIMKFRCIIGLHKDSIWVNSDIFSYNLSKYMRQIKKCKDCNRVKSRKIKWEW